MTKTFDPVEVAGAIAEIASRTLEPQTARALLELADHLLTGAGLPELRAEDQAVGCIRS
jgi:hypothetical protein